MMGVIAVPIIVELLVVGLVVCYGVVVVLHLPWQKVPVPVGKFQVVLPYAGRGNWLLVCNWGQLVVHLALALGWGEVDLAESIYMD